MTRKDSHPRAGSSGAARFSSFQLMTGIVVLGALALLYEWTMIAEREVTPVMLYLKQEAAEGADLYPDAIVASPLARDVGESDLVHLSLLHEACLKHKDAVIPWTYGLGGTVASPDSGLIERDDPHLIDKIRDFLKSRMLPAWAVEHKYVDKATGKTLTYHELCPKTPMVFFNHYWDGIPNSPDWPRKKPLYLMANIEMYELQAKHYWGVDAVLCKTAICARRLGPKALKRKDFDNVRFIHTAGTSAQKGTYEIVECWLKHPEFPQLDLVAKNDSFHWMFPAPFNANIFNAKNIRVTTAQVQPIEFGKMIAEAAFFLCTSLHEGYGHYINQARASGGVIITTDVPPMNEFLTPVSGVLVHSTRRIFKQQILGGGYMGEYGLTNVPGLTARFTGNDVCEAVERVLKMSPAQRAAMADRAKKQYFVDMNYFAYKMDELRAFARGERAPTKLRSQEEAAGEAE
ncbi:hypothetical protein PybrP1_007071 [[Pythium] brassicae (nom. inval.)]|nr:hypothetical protein PybrP1_007071 [[Pythium] brassicae (nom. inval.)]